MIENIYQEYKKTWQVTTDSRKVTKGSIFFALKGENHDGNTYAAMAIDNGAALAVIDNPAYLCDRCILVENSLFTLQLLANYHRKKLNTKIIAITGSNGKTTTKELLYTVLSKKFTTKATVGNFNNHIGVPLTLLSLSPDIEFAIVEMGANHPKDIAQLCEIAQPDYGIITNIGRAHLGGFGGFEGVKQAKGELFEYLSLHEGTVFFNPKNHILVELVDKHKVKNAIPYNEYIQNFSVHSDSTNPYLELSLLDKSGLAITIQTKLVGSYNSENVLAAYAVGKYFGLDSESIKNAIEEYYPSNNRSQLIKTKSNTVIMDAYNANPSSMEQALMNFSKIERSNKVAILGEMLELGEYSHIEHKKIADLAFSQQLSAIYLVGSEYEFSKSMANVKFFLTVDECLEYLKKEQIEGAMILLKGSRGVRLEKLLDVL